MTAALWIALGVVGLVAFVAIVVCMVALAVWLLDRVDAALQRWRRRRDNARSGVIRFPVPPVRERKWRR